MHSPLTYALIGLPLIVAAADVVTAPALPLSPAPLIPLPVNEQSQDTQGAIVPFPLGPPFLPGGQDNQVNQDNNGEESAIPSSTEGATDDDPVSGRVGDLDVTPIVYSIWGSHLDVTNVPVATTSDPPAETRGPYVTTSVITVTVIPEDSASPSSEPVVPIIPVSSLPGGTAAEAVPTAPESLPDTPSVVPDAPSVSNGPVYYSSQAPPLSAAPPVSAAYPSGASQARNGTSTASRTRPSKKPDGKDQGDGEGVGRSDEGDESASARVGFPIGLFVALLAAGMMAI